MNVVATVVAAGRGGDIDVMTPLLGVPLLVWSVRAVLASGVGDRVLVDVGAAGDAAVSACAGLSVDVLPRGNDHCRSLSVIGAHARQRAGGTDGDGRITLVHDAARPLAPPELFVAVVDAVRAGHDLVIPVLPLPDTVKQVDAAGSVRGTPDRAGLRVVQTPYAFRGDLAPVADPVAVLRTTPAHTVPGSPLAFAVRTPWDLELAELLARRS